MNKFSVIHSLRFATLQFANTILSLVMSSTHVESEWAKEESAARHIDVHLMLSDSSGDKMSDAQTS